MASRRARQSRISGPSSATWKGRRVGSPGLIAKLPATVSSVSLRRCYVVGCESWQTIAEGLPNVGSSCCCGARVRVPGLTRSIDSARVEGLRVRKRTARRKAIGTSSLILIEARPNTHFSLDFALRICGSPKTGARAASAIGCSNCWVTDPGSASRKSRPPDLGASLGA